jgi:hypothetical protein
MKGCVGRICVFRSGLLEAGGLERLLSLVPGWKLLVKIVSPLADLRLSTNVWASWE